MVQRCDEDATKRCDEEATKCCNEEATNCDEEKEISEEDRMINKHSINTENGLMTDASTEKVDDEDEGLPIDRGWAWIVAIAAHMNQLIKVGYTRSMGLLFIEFLRVYKTSATVTTLVSGIKAGIFGFAVFISMQLLVGRLQIRYLVMIGGTMSAIGIMASAFATNVTELIILQATFIGIGNSMIQGPATVLLGVYFKKKRGIGMAIASSGVSTGAVVFPPFVKYLLDVYGLQGTLLLIGGISLNVAVLGSLMRPLESYKRKKTAKVTEVKSKLLPQHLHDATRRVRNDNVVNSSSSNTNLSLPRDRTWSQSSKLSVFNSQADIPEVVLDTEQEVPKQKKSLNPCKALDFSLWRRPLFLLMAAARCLGTFAVMFLAYYPAFVVDQGTSQQDAAIFMSICGAIDFFARIGAGYLADLNYFKRTHICIFSLVISGINCHLVVLYKTYGLQLLGTIINGIFGGIFFSFNSLLLIDFLGVENLAKSLGFMMILGGMSISVYHTSIGALKDLTGSYSPGYHFMGTNLLIVAILLLLEPVVAKYDKKVKDKMIEKTRSENEATAKAN